MFFLKKENLLQIKTSQVPEESRWGERCPKYQENSKARAKSQSNITEELCKKLKELKNTTKGEGYLVLFKDFGSSNCSAKKFDTTMQTFSERINTNQASITSDHVDIPSAQELVGFLADKKKKTSYGRHMPHVWHRFSKPCRSCLWFTSNWLSLWQW